MSLTMPVPIPGANLIVLKDVEEIRKWRTALPSEKTVGFVPTMGALHQGHLDLVRRASEKCDVVVTSIFVNPTQFAPGEDFETYPRTLDSDISMLSSYPKVQVVFAPTQAVLYPTSDPTSPQILSGTFVQIEGLSDLLEGSVRLHFFRGVATVVTKLLMIVQPHYAFFGQKDGQQCVIVKRLVQDLFIPTKIVVCPTQREDDGLALSSRNRYLCPSERAKASILYEALQSASKLFKQGERNAAVLRKKAYSVLEKEPTVKIQYVSLNELQELSKVEVIEIDQPVMISAAIYLGEVRLIDNIILGEEKE